MHLRINVAIYPHCHPRSQCAPFLRHYLSEFGDLDVSPAQVTIIVPEEDPLTRPVRDLARLVTGAVSIEFAGESPHIVRCLRTPS